jgi:hypothetical protein
MSFSFSKRFLPSAALVVSCRPGNRPDCLVREVFALVAFLAILTSLQPLFADPATGISDGAVSHLSAAGVFVTVSRLGESEKEATQRDGKLLSHRRTADPFGITIRGPLRAPAPVADQPTVTPVQANPVSQVAAVAAEVNGPTLEKAVQELAVGAVNLASHQILVGSRSIREGDLLVLDSGGHQFTVWVQSVGVSGILFCDTDLQKHILKPFGFGPKELPVNSVWGISDIPSLLDSDAKP